MFRMQIHKHKLVIVSKQIKQSGRSLNMFIICDSGIFKHDNVKSMNVSIVFLSHCGRRFKKRKIHYIKITYNQCHLFILDTCLHILAFRDLRFHLRHFLQDEQGIFSLLY